MRFKRKENKKYIKKEKRSKTLIGPPGANSAHLPHCAAHPRLLAYQTPSRGAHCTASLTRGSVSLVRCPVGPAGRNPLLHRTRAANAELHGMDDRLRLATARRPFPRRTGCLSRQVGPTSGRFFPVDLANGSKSVQPWPPRFPGRRGRQLEMVFSVAFRSRGI